MGVLYSACDSPPCWLLFSPARRSCPPTQELRSLPKPAVPPVGTQTRLMAQRTDARQRPDQPESFAESRTRIDEAEGVGGIWRLCLSCRSYPDDLQPNLFTKFESLNKT